jgi:hypothetical protein
MPNNLARGINIPGPILWKWTALAPIVFNTITDRSVCTVASSVLDFGHHRSTKVIFLYSLYWSFAR